jgi:hypothetical protein
MLTSKNLDLDQKEDYPNFSGFRTFSSVHRSKRRSRCGNCPNLLCQSHDTGYGPALTSWNLRIVYVRNGFGFVILGGFSGKYWFVQIYILLSRVIILSYLFKGICLYI